jgi:type I restriction enzyme, S subunit
MIGATTQTISLASLCQLVVDCPHSTPTWTDSGVLVLRSNNIRGGRLDLSTKSYTTEEHYRDRIRRAAPREGDIVITREAPMGEVAIIPDGLRTCLGQRMVLLRPDPKKVDPRYLLFALQSASVQVQIGWHEGTGSTVSNLRIPALEALQIPVFRLEKQRVIAHILGTLDDKIKLNGRQNETLEAIARALFKSWFVDFDPVRAKAEGRDTGLPAHIAELFPDSFDDSELGEIPQGWRAGTLKELTVKIGSGATPRGGKEVYVEEGIAFIRSQNVYDSEFVWDGLAYITAKQADDLTNVEVAKGDVLMNITGASILRTCIVQPSVLPARVNQHVAIIRAKPGIPNRFLHIHLLQKSTKDYLLGMNAGASREAVTKGHIESVPILVPAPTVLNRFENLTDAWSRKIERNTAEIRNLTALRNMLLPKLLSGACGAGIDWSFARG